MFGEHGTNPLDRGADAVAGVALLHLGQQRSHRFAPNVVVGNLQDRFVGHDLGTTLGH